MQFKELLGMGPLEKYQRHNLPPYRAVVGLLLVFFTTLETLTMIKANMYSNVNQIKSFTYIYFDSEVYNDEIFIQSQHFNIRETDELIRHLKYIFDGINSIGEDTFQRLSFDNAKMKVYTYYQTYSEVERGFPVVEVDIKQGHISSPFDSKSPRSIQDYLFNVSMMEIVISDIELNISGSRTMWTHKLSYEFNERAELDIRIEMFTQTNSSPQGTEGYYLRMLIVVYVIVFVLASCSLILNYSYFTKLSIWLVDYSAKLRDRNRVEVEPAPTYMYDSLAEWMTENQVPLRNLTVAQWLQLIDILTIMSTIGNSCQIIGSIFLIFNFKKSVVVGIGCLMSWLGIFTYLKYIPRFTVLNQVLSKSMPKLIVFLIEFVPVFMAFLLFATTSFWKVEQFSSSLKALDVQMCMMLGDSIALFTTMISDKYEKYLAIFYTFGFVLCFMHGIHNLLTGLIKEHFINNKIEKARRRLHLKGMSHKTSIEELKPSYEQRRNWWTQ